MAQHVGILGSGQVGAVLARGFKKYGFGVSIGSRDGKKVDGWDGEVGSFSDVASKSELIVLAVKGLAAEEVVRSVKGSLSGKTVIDTTNPIAEAPPEHGVIKFFTSLDESLMERLQNIAPEAHFVKAFNSIGNAFMVNPDFGGVKPTMFIAGNDEKAKKEVTSILNTFGFETEDMGMAAGARAIEPLCILWCIPGLLHNQWSHVFKLLKK